MTYPPAMMRRKTAAAYLDMSVDTFDRHVAAGSLPAPAKWGRADYWRRDALDAAIAAASGEALPDWEAKLYDKLKGKAA